MELKEGYKQTDVGVIPEDWEVVQLGHLTNRTITYGVVTSGGHEAGGVPMLRGGDIKNGVVANPNYNISFSKHEEYKRTETEAGDVVMTLVGYPGETAVVPESLGGINISRAVALIRLGPSYDPEFFKHYANSSSGRINVLRPSAGSAQVVVNLAALAKLKVPFPQLVEQRAIAEVLSDVDAEIAQAEMLVEKLKAKKAALSQKLLSGEIRLNK